MDQKSGSIDSVSCKKKHKTESDTIDPVLYFYISSGNLAVLANARVRSLVLRPGLSTGLPLSDLGRHYILTNGRNLRCSDKVHCKLLGHYSQFFTNARQQSLDYSSKWKARCAEVPLRSGYEPPKRFRLRYRAKLYQIRYSGSIVGRNTKPR
jgi:hypothetical protein